MNENAVICTEEAPLENVCQLIADNDLEFVTVVESRAHRIPIGIITERDVCRKIVGRGRSPQGLTAANVMSTDVARVSVAASAAHCSDLMQASGVKVVFVVDEDGTLCGTLSRSDVERARTPRPAETLFGGAVAQQKYQVPGINRLF